MAFSDEDIQQSFGEATKDTLLSSQVIRDIANGLLKSHQGSALANIERKRLEQEFSYEKAKQRKVNPKKLGGRLRMLNKCGS